MPFRYGEVGICLKANRLGSGLGADAIANQLGISPAERGAHKRAYGSYVAGKKIDLIA
jgi:hypothetical protein